MLSESLFESNKASSDVSWKPSNHDEDIDEDGRKEAKKKKNLKEAQSVEAKGFVPLGFMQSKSCAPLDKLSCKKVLVKYNIRKRKLPDKKAPAKHKDYHRRRRCPVNQCHSVCVFRLPAHLQKIHKIKTFSKEYIDTMETVCVVLDHVLE
ncbi:Hypothetical predicted protein [Paramuricea clavata]|uniref:Uncharacterized protein n=1 Tax=Paramuricea clavata TaxID=317549 RepID=A0A7D9JEA7_PARCT|nr:Hypothetical predicted protein [Paramuricea clavata]